MLSITAHHKTSFRQALLGQKRGPCSIFTDKAQQHLVLEPEHEIVNLRYEREYTLTVYVACQNLTLTTETEAVIFVKANIINNILASETAPTLKVLL